MEAEKRSAVRWMDVCMLSVEVKAGTEEVRRLWIQEAVVRNFLEARGEGAIGETVLVRMVLVRKRMSSRIWAVSMLIPRVEVESTNRVRDWMRGLSRYKG